jgi:hypothetical protein
MAIVGPDGRLLDLNEHLAEIVGRPREQLVHSVATSSPSSART